ncbi:hypothetical protein N7465_002851 [Penicillium sp. CMV-2018d]|nr:hypothetical protein N7465_002851 [Penicillium sp. CMV-2018d]
MATQQGPARRNGVIGFQMTGAPTPAIPLIALPHNGPIGFQLMPGPSCTNPPTLTNQGPCLILSALPIRTSIDLETLEPCPPLSQESRESLLHMAKEATNTEFQYPYASLRPALKDSFLPMIRADLGVRRLDGRETDPVRDLKGMNLIFNTGAHRTIIAEELLCTSFREYLGDPVHDPYRRNDCLSVHLDVGIALSNCPVTMDLVAAVIPTSKMLNHLVGILFGQAGCIDRLGFPAVSSNQLLGSIIDSCRCGLYLSSISRALTKFFFLPRKPSNTYNGRYNPGKADCRISAVYPPFFLGELGAQIARLCSSFRFLAQNHIIEHGIRNGCSVWLLMLITPLLAVCLLTLHFLVSAFPSRHRQWLLSRQPLPSRIELDGSPGRFADFSLSKHKSVDTEDHMHHWHSAIRSFRQSAVPIVEESGSNLSLFARGKDIRDPKKSLENTQNNVEAKSNDLQEADKTLINYERTFDAHTMEVRSTVLDKWAGKPISNTRRSQRNAAAHGGSILADYDVILREVDQPDSRVDRWKPVFESHYNVSWDFLYVRGRLDSASRELIRIFDYLANIRSLEKWEDWKIQSNPNTSSKKMKDRAKIVEICTSWIDKWVGDTMDTNPTKAQMDRHRLRQLSHQA